MDMIRLMEMREKIAELDTQYRVRRLQEIREAAVMEMLNLRSVAILTEKQNN